MSGSARTTKTVWQRNRQKEKKSTDTQHKMQAGGKQAQGQEEERHERALPDELHQS